jgi:aspartate carbamoyltransferase catalytic subunit
MPGLTLPPACSPPLPFPSRPISPPAFPPLQDMLTSRGVNWQEVSDLKEVASEVDVLYQTRIQKERFTNLEDYEKVRGQPRSG